MADTLLSQLLAASWAHRDDRSSPPPRLARAASVVLLTCSEPGAGADGGHLAKLFALPPARVHVVRAAGARVPSSTGEVAHSVGAALTGSLRSEVLVIGHAGCRYIATSDFAGAIGGRFGSVEESVRASVRALQSTALLPAGTAVHGLVVEPDGKELTLVEDGYWAVSVVDAPPEDDESDDIDADPGVGTDAESGAEPEATPAATADAEAPLADAELELDAEPVMALEFPAGSPAPETAAPGASNTLVLEVGADEPAIDPVAARAQATVDAFARAEQILRDRLGSPGDGASG